MGYRYHQTLYGLQLPHITHRCTSVVCPLLVDISTHDRVLCCDWLMACHVISSWIVIGGLLISTCSKSHGRRSVYMQTRKVILLTVTMTTNYSYYDYYLQLPWLLITVTMTTTYSYLVDSPEILLRRLGDISFLLQHYTMAYSSYHQVKRDFQNDQAYNHYAAALVS